MAEVFIDSGHKMILVKELSTHPKHLNEDYLANKIGIKLATYFLVFFFLTTYGYLNEFWGYNPIIILFVSLSGLMLSLSNVNISIFHSHNKYLYETITLFIFSFFLGIALILSRLFVSELSFMFGYMIGSFMMFVTSFFIVRKSIIVLSIRLILSKMTFAGIKKELLIVLPFSSIVIVEAIFGNFDTLLVENYCSSIDLGIYSGVKKIIAGLTILMLVCGSALMPLLSRMSKSTLLSTKFKILSLFGIISFLGVCIFFLYFLFNEYIIQLLLGDKFSVITEWDTQIGIMTLAMYVRIVPGIYFITADREKVRLWITALALILGGSYLMQTLPGHNVKYAVSVITNIHLVTTIAYTLAFLVVLFYPQRRYVRINRETK